MSEYSIFEASDVVLQSGLTYRNARLAYKTYGTLNAAKSNAIVYPTSYGAQHTDLEWLVAEGKGSTRAAISSSSSTNSATGCRRARAIRHHHSIVAAIRVSP